MNLSKKKLELVQMILNAESSSVLEKVESLLKREQESDWWDDLSEAQRKDIEKAVEELENGEGIPHAEVMREVKEKVKIPLASGERIYTRWGYRPYIENQVLSVIQPDL